MVREEKQRAAGERTAGGALHLLRSPSWCPGGSEMRLFQVKGEVVDRAFLVERTARAKL